jgi:hypothetical protein
MDETEEIFSLNRALFLAQLQQLSSTETLASVRSQVADIVETLDGPQNGVPANGSEPNTDTTATIEVQRCYLYDALNQIAETRTLERARYYIERLTRSLTEVKTTAINDININRWKEYDHIRTDSLWYEPRRDNSGVHTADYWGNFIPQIPYQMMLRYTRKGDWVLDTFAGAGTTLIEGQRLGRHTIGIELQASIADQARQRVAAEDNPSNVVLDIVNDDCTLVDYPALLKRHGQQHVQLVMMHPPYFDIIKFSADQRDLSNAPSLDAFLAQMGAVVEKVAPVLERGRFLVLVIGDKYASGEWIPLGFLTMQAVLQHGFLLKSIIVKNFDQTAGKRTQSELWRYRALVNGFYIFKHEYIFVFQKR